MMLEDAAETVLVMTQAQQLALSLKYSGGWNICVIANRYRSVTPYPLGCRYQVSYRFTSFSLIFWLDGRPKGVMVGQRR